MHARARVRAQIPVESQHDRLMRMFIEEGLADVIDLTKDEDEDPHLLKAKKLLPRKTFDTLISKMKELRMEMEADRQQRVKELVSEIATCIEGNEELIESFKPYMPAWWLESRVLRDMQSFLDERAQDIKEESYRQLSKKLYSLYKKL